MKAIQLPAGLGCGVPKLNLNIGGLIPPSAPVPLNPVCIALAKPPNIEGFSGSTKQKRSPQFWAM